MSELDELQRQRATIDAQIKEIERREREEIIKGAKTIDKQRKAQFAKRLWRARRAAKLTQLDVASRLMLSVTGYASYEQGKNEPSLPTLIRICETLKVSADELLGLKEE